VSDLLSHGQMATRTNVSLRIDTGCGADGFKCHQRPFSLKQPYNKPKQTLALLYGLKGHCPPQARSVENTIDISGLSSGHASSIGTGSFGYDAVSLSNDLSTRFHDTSSGLGRSEPLYCHRCHNYHS
jgi:hypothetical protein